jgi:hypothetical protein
MPQLSDQALAVFAFAIYHQLQSETRVTSVVADDHAGHRAYRYVRPPAECSGTLMGTRA